MPKIITEATRAAARANGAKSRGPKTEAGRQRSSQNAIKHGLCSNLVVLSNESEEKFESYRQAYLDRFQPADQVGIDLVDQMVAASWRMHRIWRMEASALEREMDRVTPELEKKYETFKEDTRLSTAMENLMDDSRSLSNLSRHEARLVRTYHQALNAFNKICTTIPASVNPNPPSVNPNPPSVPPNPPATPQPETQTPQNEPKPPQTPAPSPTPKSTLAADKPDQQAPGGNQQRVRQL